MYGLYNAIYTYIHMYCNISFWEGYTKIGSFVWDTESGAGGVPLEDPFPLCVSVLKVICVSVTYVS